MLRCASFLAVLPLLLAASPAIAQVLPQALQPSEYPPSEGAALLQGIAKLQTVLTDYFLGPRKALAADEWGSRDFAAYTAGILTGKGYKTVLVSAPGWPDGVHTWVLVELPLDGKAAWVPVEAAPVANIRSPASAIIPGETTRLFALGSKDPDGEIVLYTWNFGDGKSKVYTNWVARHTSRLAGDYTLSLTVDSRGASTSTTLLLHVNEEGEAAPSSTTPSSGGCGCRK